MSEPESQTDITFEQGLARLEAIAREIESDDVALARSVELVQEGRELERALRAYLDEVRGELERIEAEPGTGRFRVVRAPETPEAPAA